MGVIVATKPEPPLFNLSEIGSTAAMAMPAARNPNEVHPGLYIHEGKAAAHGGVPFLGDHGDGSANPFEQEAAPAPKRRRAASPSKPKAASKPRKPKPKA